MKLVLIALTILFSSLQANALEPWSFEQRRYYEPLIAGVREPHLSALFAAFGDPVQFQIVRSNPRWIVDADVGGELPVIGWDSGAGDDARVPENTWGWGLWIPIDFHLLQNLRDRSDPIINNDYRYGIMVKAQYGLATNDWLGVRLHVGHESTHLGDEFSIISQREFPRTFERINISWEYADLGVLYEHLQGQPFYSIRGGATYNLDGSYYTTDRGSITESPRAVTRSKNRLDWYGGVELRWEEALGKWDVYTSAELRWRSVYDYHKTSPSAPEEKQASINIIAGVKVNGENKASPFFRYYHGVNPHGQFRNQKDYTELGFGIRLVR